MRLLVLIALIPLLAASALAQEEHVVADLRVTLPPSWEGSVTGDESRAPQRLSYAFANDNAESPLYRARLVVYRVVGLNRIDRNDWWRGRLPYGLAGMRPVAGLPPDQVILENTRGYRTEGGGLAGNIYLTQYGPAFYAIHIMAPIETFEDQLPGLLEIVRSIEFRTASVRAN